MPEKKRRSLPRTAGKLLVLLLVLASLILLGARCWFRLPVWDYYRVSEKAFAIPGLGEGFVPQGLDYDGESGNYFVTGYRKSGASPVYLTPEAGGEAKAVFLQAPDGTDFTGHAGGLSVHGEYVYVAGGEDCCLYVYRRGDFLAAENGASVPCLGTFAVSLPQSGGLTVAFTAVHDGMLLAGEFYREQNYPTKDSHKLHTPGGDYNQAIALSYAFSDGEGALFGLSPEPVMAWSLPDQVQGLCVRDDLVLASASYGLAFSHILAYDRQKIAPAGELEGIPLLALDSASLTAEMKFPPMSEEIIFSRGKLLTMCESASNKYFFGKLTGGKWCYATDLSALLQK